MGKDAQKSRRLKRVKRTVGATQPVGYPQGYHDLRNPTLCRCGKEPRA